MACDICSRIAERKGLLYEDSEIAALLAPQPAAAGHIIVAPKQHAAIIEQVPDAVAAALFNRANRMSTAVFEGLGAHGTNIIAQNGVAAGQRQPHFTLHIIPRSENDRLNFQWQTKQLSEEEMGAAELMLREGAKKAGVAEGVAEKEKPIEEKKPEKIERSEENYMIKHMERLP